MDIAAFRRVLTTFADSPADISLERGQVLVQVRGDLLSGSLRDRDGAIVVSEGSVDYPGLKWIVDRVAQIPLLADRILTQVEAEQYFVTPRAEVLDDVNRATTEEVYETPDALGALRDLLSRDASVGTCGVTYLVSDAGEGKTTIINMLARYQAQAFKRKEASWLLVPILLGGRPFIRFDDVVAGAFLNRFRFPLFFDSFIELVRRGIIVPALDGFEEMFIESAAGDAASALASLLNLLQSSGNVLVAARQAYFDYKNLDTKTRLLEALAGQSVSFSRVRVQRWGEEQFVEYASKRGVLQSGAVYARLSEHLSPSHALLTRAVLATRVVELALEAGGVERLVALVDGNATDYFGQLVRPIVAREAVKWIDKSGEPLQSLLTPDDHLDLLDALAQEMWLAETSVVSADVLELAAELYCTAGEKSAAVTRQVLERIKSHALLVNRAGAGRRESYEFDHEEFFHYFLGRGVARAVRGDFATIKALLRRTSLPALALDVAGMRIREEGDQRIDAIRRLSEVSKTEPAASFVRENAGSIVLRALDGFAAGGTVVDGLVFPREGLRNRSVRAVTFEHCEFGETELGENALVDVVARGCRFDALWVRSQSAFTRSRLLDCSVRAIAGPDMGFLTYDPEQVLWVLKELSAIEDPRPGTAPASEVTEWDEELKETERVVRKFFRSTEINENTLRQAVGSGANLYLRDTVPVLEEAGVLREVRYQGHGSQRRFRLGRAAQQIGEALKGSGGSFRRFLELVGRQ